MKVYKCFIKFPKKFNNLREISTHLLKFSQIPKRKDNKIHIQVRIKEEFRVMIQDFFFL
jgi:hypothetical protein